MKSTIKQIALLHRCGKGFNDMLLGDVGNIGYCGYPQLAPKYGAFVAASVRQPNKYPSLHLIKN